MKKSFKEARLEIKSILRKAASLIESKNYRKAVEELEKYRSAIRQVDFYLLLAEAYEALGDKDKAETYFEEARFLDTEIRSKEKLRRGTSLAAIRNFRAAEKELLESIRLNPFEKDAYLELYRLYREMSNYRGMVKALENLLTVNPYSVFSYLELSRIYEMRRQLKRAEEVLLSGISITDSTKLHFELGKLYAEMGRVEEAKMELSTACRLDFRNVEYRQKLAEVMVNNEEYEEALEVVMSTLEMFPDAVYVIQSAATLYDLLGKEEIAEHYYRLAVSKSKGFVKEDAEKLLSEFLLEKGKFDAAEEILKELIKTTDNIWILLDSFSELAILLIEQDRLEEVVEIGKTILENPELSEVEYCEVAEIVADALYEMLDYVEAIKYYKKLVNCSTDEKLIKRAYSKLREVEDIESLERMLKSS